MQQSHRDSIDNELYTRVKLIIESQYNLEGVVNPDKKDSTKIIFKDRPKAITMVKELILEFAKENGLDTHEITEYLMGKIKEEMQRQPEFREELEETQKIVSIEDDVGDR